jgi:hypothetical protein
VKAEGRTASSGGLTASEPKGTGSRFALCVKMLAEVVERVEVPGLDLSHLYP